MLSFVVERSEHIQGQIELILFLLHIGRDDVFEWWELGQESCCEDEAVKLYFSALDEFDIGIESLVNYPVHFRVENKVYPVPIEPRLFEKVKL